MGEKLGLDATDRLKERTILKKLDRKCDNTTEMPRLRDFYCITEIKEIYIL